MEYINHNIGLKIFENSKHDEWRNNQHQIKINLKKISEHTEWNKLHEFKILASKLSYFSIKTKDWFIHHFCSGKVPPEWLSNTSYLFISLFLSSKGQYISFYTPGFLAFIANNLAHFASLMLYCLCSHTF
jgi:hypothetical protein